MRRAILFVLLALPVLAGDFSYVYVRPEGSAMISRGSLSEILRLRERLKGEFLWARLDGRQYLIRDAATLEEVRKAFEPLEALGVHQRALHARMRPVELRFERLEEEADSLRDLDDLNSEQRARLRAVDRALRELQPELRTFEYEERRLDARETALESVFDAAIERIVKRAVRAGSASRLR